MARSSDDIEELRPSETAPLESAGVLPSLKKCRHGGGSKHRLCCTGPPTVPSGQSKGLLNSWGVALQQVKGTEMLAYYLIFPGFTYCIVDISKAAAEVSGQLTRCVNPMCACMFILVI